MKEYIDHIILPYIIKKREELKLASNYPALLTFDNFKAQCTPGIFTLLDNINVVLVPANCTDRLQPLDFKCEQICEIFFAKPVSDLVHQGSVLTVARTYRKQACRSKA